MTVTTAKRLAVLLVLVPLVGCAARVSARTVRDEIVRQTGRAPASEFELNLGTVTTALVRSALGAETVSTEGLPIRGLRRLELAVFGLGQDGRGSGPIDLGALGTPRGWDASVRWKGPESSALVLVRPVGERVGDLVLVAGGERQVVYARLAGTLSKDLPAALRDAVAEGGPERVRNALVEAAAEGP